MNLLDRIDRMQYTVQRNKRENSVKNLNRRNEMLILNPEHNINCKETAWNGLSLVCVNSSGSEAQPDWHGIFQGLIGPACHEKCPRWKVTALGAKAVPSHGNSILLWRKRKAKSTICALYESSYAKVHSDWSTVLFFSLIFHLSGLSPLAFFTFYILSQ